jgi:hypothetical protein
MAAERQLREVAPHLSPADAAERQYVLLSRALDGDLSMLDFSKRSFLDQSLTTLWLRLPWERTRARRLLNLQTLCDLAIGMEEPEGGCVTSLDNAKMNLVLVTQRRLSPLRSSELLSALRTLIGVEPISRDWGEGADGNRWPPTTLSESYRAVETARRAAHLVLALQAWKLKHGSLPKSLDELVGPYLDRLPTDPYSHIPFRYFRDGVKIPLHWEQPLWGWPVMAAQGTVSPNEAFIWSAGPRISVQTPNANGDILSQYLIRPKWPYGDRRARNNWPHTANSEFDIWESGWPFPIP